jgi:hypothetical protein
MNELTFLWLSEVRSGKEVAINPSDIVKIEAFECYISSREDAPNRFIHPEQPAGPHYANGATLTLRGQAENVTVEQTIDDIRKALNPEGA